MKEKRVKWGEWRPSHRYTHRQSHTDRYTHTETVTDNHTQTDSQRQWQTITHRNNRTQTITLGRTISHLLFISSIDGSTTSLPSISPTLTQPIGPAHGWRERLRAREVALTAAIDGSKQPSIETNKREIGRNKKEIGRNKRKIGRNKRKIGDRRGK